MIETQIWNEFELIKHIASVASKIYFFILTYQ